MNYEELLELFALEALGILTDSEQQRLQEGMVEFPELEAEWVALQETTNLLAYGTPLLEPPPDLKSRLFERVLPASSEQIAALKQQAEGISWQPYEFSDNVMVGTVQIDLQTRQITFYTRAFGNVRFPRHKHGGKEEIIVLEGDLMIDGQYYKVGDRIHSDPNTAHQPETQGGCLLFVRTSLDDQAFV